jgi:hypothetical protein
MHGIDKAQKNKSSYMDNLWNNCTKKPKFLANCIYEITVRQKVSNPNMYEDSWNNETSFWVAEQQIPETVFLVAWLLKNPGSETYCGYLDLDDLKILAVSIQGFLPRGERQFFAPTFF